MEQQKLPNVTIAMVLGILSFFCCCLSMGIGGILLSGIALFLVNKDVKLYQQNPEDYSNYNTLKTVRTIAIVGLVLGLVSLAWSIYSLVSVGGWEGYLEQNSELFEQFGLQ
ncbi:MAG: hypothetical protein ACJA1P_002115 [Maribacter sp.]|jgi:hypothetical protein